MWLRVFFFFLLAWLVLFVFDNLFCPVACRVDYFVCPMVCCVNCLTVLMWHAVVLSVLWHTKCFNCEC